MQLTAMNTARGCECALAQVYLRPLAATTHHPAHPGPQTTCRMLYVFAELKVALTEWGVPAVEVEMQAESQRAYKQFGTDW